MTLASTVTFALLVAIEAISRYVNDDLLKTVHFDSIGRHRLAKRAAFNSRVGMLEIVFAFLVNVHFFLASDTTTTTTTTTTTGELCECRGRFDRGRFLADLFPFLVVGVLFLSISRCLLQIVAVSKLSRSDIASMTRVYIVPFTFVATALCVSSWISFPEYYYYYYYYYPLTDNRCDLFEWFQRTAGGGNHCVLCYAVAWIFASAVVEFFRHNASVTPARCTTGVPARCTTGVPARCTLDVASSFRHEEVSSFVFACKNATEKTVVKDLEKQEALSEAEITKVNNQYTFVASADKTASSLLLPSGSRAVSPKPTGRSCMSVWVFLRQSAWLHMSLLMYFLILMGAYEYMECSFAYVAFRFHRAAVFSALLAANALWRIIQILAFGHFFRRTLRSYSCTDV